MADPDTTQHVTRETRIEKRSGSTAMAFIVGGVVVAVAILAWVVFGGGDGSAPADATGPAAGDTTNITVETPAPDIAPADDAAAPSDPAPAEDAAPAPSGD